MSLKSKDVLIRPTSTADINDDVIPDVSKWINKLEKKYKHQYFAKIFDTRINEHVYVYSKGCKDKYDMTELVIWLKSGTNDTTTYIL